MKIVFSVAIVIIVIFTFLLAKVKTKEKIKVNWLARTSIFIGFFGYIWYFAIDSICSLLSFICKSTSLDDQLFPPLLSFIFGILLGCVGYIKPKNNNFEKDWRAIAIYGIFLSVIGLILILPILMYFGGGQ